MDHRVRHVITVIEGSVEQHFSQLYSARTVNISCGRLCHLSDGISHSQELTIAF